MVVKYSHHIRTTSRKDFNVALFFRAQANPAANA
jgi:hypothetical protein